MEAATDAIRGLLQSYSKQDILLGVVIFQAICAVPFMICSIVVSGTANAGFNCVLTSFLNIAYVAGAFFVVRNSKAPIAVSSSLLPHFLYPVIKSTLSSMDLLLAVEVCYWYRI